MRLRYPRILTLRFFDLLDYLERSLRNKKHIPPLSLRLLYSGQSTIWEFEEVGTVYSNLVMNFLGTKHTLKVLDLGCGVGKLALAFANCYSTCDYIGIDISKQAITWCCENISEKFPNFTFYHLDTYHPIYNPTGKILKQYLPFPHGAFDQVIAISVFTHLLPDEQLNYLSEISRCLKLDGKFFLTFFIIDKKTQQNIQRISHFQFKKYQNFYTLNASNPREGVAMDLEMLKSSFFGAKLYISQIFWGNWRYRAPNPRTIIQDILIGSKVDTWGS